MQNSRKSTFCRIVSLIFPVALALLAAGCLKVDLSSVEDRIDSLDTRLAALEKAVGGINGSISALNEAIEKLQKKVYVSNVITKDDLYIIKFTDGTMLEIHSGTSGKNAPMIGVSKDTDGRYYWTVTVGGSTKWLQDDKGAKMPVSGRDGKDGADGRDGSSGEEGVSILPVVGIDSEGYWTVSYDSGKTTSRIKDAEGKDVKAVEKDVTGGGDSIFRSIEDLEDCVILTLHDGSKVTLEKFRKMSLAFSVADSLKIQNNHGEFTFEIKGDSNGASVETTEKGVLVSEAVMEKGTKGVIKVDAFGVWTKDCAVIVLLYNAHHTVTYVIPVAKYEFEDNTTDPEKEIHIPDEMKPHIPIYKGSNPPVLDGTYLMEPNECVYCSDEGHGGYPRGTVCVSEIFRFSNMSTLSRTIDVKNEDIRGYSVEEGLGYYISGSGNNFTVYANVDGQNEDGIMMKMSYLISGTKTSSGLKDFYQAFIMQWKSAAGDLMDIGAFRVFKDGDGLAVPTSWIEFTKGAYPMMTNGVNLKNNKFRYSYE